MLTLAVPSQLLVNLILFKKRKKKSLVCTCEEEACSWNAIAVRAANGGGRKKCL
ncbi:uncharacterized protein G2W53_045032 [Senna tora]|uniref:Uncharacterized protein n=1 Tax=Senna tora TaxID=362788 RepID=A0A834VX47_9FABA|nr:uncharacterized protein G2W53_045032 [Senna tora]